MIEMYCDFVVFFFLIDTTVQNRVQTSLISLLFPGNFFSSAFHSVWRFLVPSVHSCLSSQSSDWIFTSYISLWSNYGCLVFLFSFLQLTPMFLLRKSSVINFFEQICYVRSFSSIIIDDTYILSYLVIGYFYSLDFLADLRQKSIFKDNKLAMDVFACHTIHRVRYF